MTPILTEHVHVPAMPGFLANGGEMGALISVMDWSETSLGAPEGWPRTLKSMLATLLSYPHPMFVAWGPDLLVFFNDAYRPMLGERLGGLFPMCRYATTAARSPECLAFAAKPPGRC